MKNYFDENDYVLKKALLFISPTEENIAFFEESYQLYLIQSEETMVEVQMGKDETEFVPHEMYDIILNGRTEFDIPGEFFTLTAHE